MTLTSDFFDDPLGFAQQNSICPPSNIKGYKGKEAKTLDTSGFVGVGRDSGGQVASIKYSRVMRNKKVGYLELFTDTRPGGAAIEDRNDEGSGVVRMKSKFAAFGDAQASYFLPWDESGAIVKLRLPARGTHNPDPDVFFTAAINGCSVFVQGAPDSPTVYHAGGSTGRADHNDAARFWRQALANHLQSSRSGQARGQLRGEVNKTHYVKTPGTQGNSTTPTAEHYEQELKDRLNKKSFTVTMVNPWGCVFGLRTGNDWAFYLQENGTVICNYVTKRDVRTVYYAKPMRLSQIFPGGSSRIASMSHNVPVKIT